MKKIFLALAAIATFASCADDSLVENEGQGKTQQMTFVASMDDDASTRTAIDSDNKVLWSTGDAISILGVGNTSNSEFTLSSGAGTTKGTFTGSCPTSTTGYYAAYPYNEANGWESDYVKIHWNGSAQVAQECYSTGTYEICYPEGTPMIAYATGDASSKTVSMQFKHICAYFKVFIHTSVKAISISANTTTDALTAEDILVSWNGGAPKVEGTVNRSNQVTLAGKDGATLEPGCYYIPVLPATITSGITLTLVSATVSGTYTKSSTTGEVTLARNNIYDLGEFSVESWHTLSGAGTEATPYKIGNFSDLQTMSALINNNLGSNYRSAYYEQTADITCQSNQKIDAIGNNDYQFNGTYDGDNHKIINPNYTGGALFGRVNGGTIKSLTIVDPSWDTSTDHAFSGLVECVYLDKDNKTNTVSIDQCTVTGTSTKTVTMNHYGALVGTSFGNTHITDCTSSLNMNICTTKESTWIGGIIGKVNPYQYSDDDGSWSKGDVNCEVNRCRNNADIQIDTHQNSAYALGEGLRFGGIVGEIIGWISDVQFNTKVYNCVNNGTLSIDSSNRNALLTYHMGGIVGGCSTLYGAVSEIKNCINNGTISNPADENHKFNVGGILGWTYQTDGDKHSNTHLLLCANTGTLSSNHYGAIIGEGKVYDTTTMAYCYNSYTTCHFLAYPEGGDSNGIKTWSNCAVNTTNVLICSDANPYIANNSLGSTFSAWKESGSGLDLNF